MKTNFCLSIFYSKEDAVSHKLYNHIAEEICRRIADGDYPAGSKLASHRDLSAEFKVSSRTIYKALAELKARGVFRPTPRGSFITGHGVKDDKTQVIAVVTQANDFLTLGNDPLKQEIFSAAAQAGYETVLVKLNRQSFKSLISFYNQSFCGGIIFIYSTGYYLQNHSDLDLQIPYVCTNYIPGIARQHYVWQDWRKNFFKSVENKLKTGYKKIALACHSPGQQGVNYERMDCWQDICNYFNIKNFSPDIDFFTRKFLDNIPYWFADENDCPDCILCCELPFKEQDMHDALQLLAEKYPTVKVFCDIKWSKFGFENCEYFGLHNDLLYKKLGSAAWEKLMQQKENMLKNTAKNKEMV